MPIRVGVKSKSVRPHRACGPGFCMVADRDHRGITGLSMGGQSKDLVSSVSAFDPVQRGGRQFFPSYSYTGHENIWSVSYTHLRAHETVLDLVCRLLLEKKK